MLFGKSEIVHLDLIPVPECSYSRTKYQPFDSLFHDCLGFHTRSINRQNELVCLPKFKSQDKLVCRPAFVSLFLFCSSWGVVSVGKKRKEKTSESEEHLA